LVSTCLARPQLRRAGAIGYDTLGPREEGPQYGELPASPTYMDPRPTPQRPDYFDPQAAADYDAPTFSRREPAYADVSDVTGPRGGYAPLGQSTISYDEPAGLGLSADEPMYADAAAGASSHYEDVGRTGVTSNPAYAGIKPATPYEVVDPDVDGLYDDAANLRPTSHYDQPTFTKAASLLSTQGESFDRPTFSRAESLESTYDHPTFMRLPRDQVRAVEAYAGLVPLAPLRRKACLHHGNRHVLSHLQESI
jgi:hypothetical protein